MVKGYITNNTGRSRHIFKKTVYPGQKITLERAYKLVGSKIPKGSSFVDWLKDYLPEGWEVNVLPQETSDYVGGRQYKEVLTALPLTASDVVEVAEDPLQKIDGEVKDPPSLEFSTPRAVAKMTARDIFNLRIKDNPRRILKNIDSIHKLRRALSLCKTDSRKATISRLIRGRIKELNVTL